MRKLTGFVIVAAWVAIAFATTAQAQSPSMYGYSRDLAPPTQGAQPQGDLSVAVQCHPWGVFDDSMNGRYVMRDRDGWGTLEFHKSGRNIRITAVSSSSEWVAGDALLPTNPTGEVIFAVWDRRGPGNYVGLAKVCRGPDYGFGFELRLRVVVQGQLSIPTPMNDCQANTLDRCMQRFHPLP